MLNIVELSNVLDLIRSVSIMICVRPRSQKLAKIVVHWHLQSEKLKLWNGPFFFTYCSPSFLNHSIGVCFTGSTCGNQVGSPPLVKHYLFLLLETEFKKKYMHLNCVVGSWMWLYRLEGLLGHKYRRKLMKRAWERLDINFQKIRHWNGKTWQSNK